MARMTVPSGQPGEPSAGTALLGRKEGVQCAKAGPWARPGPARWDHGVPSWFQLHGLPSVPASGGRSRAGPACPLGAGPTGGRREQPAAAWSRLRGLARGYLEIDVSKRQIRSGQGVARGRHILLSEQSEACVITSSDDVTLSSSIAVSSGRLLLCTNSSLMVPFAVTHTRELLDGLGCQGPEAG